MHTDFMGTSQTTMPSPEAARKMSDDELVQKLKALGTDIDKLEFIQLAKQHLSVQKLIEPFDERYSQSEQRTENDDPREEHWIWLCCKELWIRWVPDEPCLEIWHDMVLDAYNGELKNSDIDVSNNWLQAWQLMRKIIEKAGAGVTIEEIEENYEKGLIRNWIQEMLTVLWNAGVDDSTYLDKLIALCQEVLQHSSQDNTNPFVLNLKEIIALTYAQKGDRQTADDLFRDLTEAFPEEYTCWLRWAISYSDDDYDFTASARTREIFKEALSKKAIKKRHALIDTVCRIYKIGRKDSCFCNSGKKFKRCCGT